MSQFHTVARVGEIPAGEARAFQVAGRMVAVFFSDGVYHAINDSCPHMGASLATGWLENNEVTCPWHAWRFCIEKGTWLDNPQAKLKTDSYATRVVDEEIQVELPESTTAVDPEENDEAGS